MVSKKLILFISNQYGLSDWLKNWIKINGMQTNIVEKKIKIKNSQNIDDIYINH